MRRRFVFRRIRKPGSFTPRHRVSPTTGRYRGRVVVDLTAKIEREERRRKARELEAMRSGEPTKAKEEAETEASTK